MVAERFCWWALVDETWILEGLIRLLSSVSRSSCYFLEETIRNHLLEGAGMLMSSFCDVMTQCLSFFKTQKEAKENKSSSASENGAQKQKKHQNQSGSFEGDSTKKDHFLVILGHDSHFWALDPGMMLGALWWVL